MNTKQAWKAKQEDALFWIVFIIVKKTVCFCFCLLITYFLTKIISDLI